MMFAIIARYLFYFLCHNNNNYYYYDIKKGDLPWWHSKKRHKEVEAMLSDNKSEYLREVRGIQSEKDIFPVFNHIFVDLLLHDSSIYTNDHYPKNIFTVIDPACGGEYSQHAVSTFMYDRGTMVVS
jgi:hypothetical protein